MAILSKLTCIINLISASPKRRTKLRSDQAIEIERGITSCDAPKPGCPLTTR